MTAKDILGKAAAMLDARASDRDKPDGERSMGKIVGCFNIATGHNLSERDGWLFMVFLKAVRAATTPHGKPDDYIDGPAYFALAGEAASTPAHNKYTFIGLPDEQAYESKSSAKVRTMFDDINRLYEGVPAVVNDNGRLTVVDRETYAKCKGGAV